MDASSATAAPSASTPARTPARAEASAERRQLTVLFCDLVGSTALASSLDPEDLREVIGAYHRCVARIVARFDGFVAKYMGDGVLVYFGYPKAHEDDAERAVRAGLTLVSGVNALKLRSDTELQVRVGIATGLVVVGDLTGSGEAQERGVVGETPNLAGRLQGIADANAVVIAPSTRRLLGSLFDYRDLGAVEAKGFADRVHAWQVLRDSSVESRFEALHAGSGLTPLVGRDEEIELLLRRWARAKTGEGQVVLLAGEPGIGKSRVATTLQERLQGEPHIRLRYFCSPHHSDSALYPVITHLEHAAGFEREDGPERRLEKLEALLARSRNRFEDDLPFLAELLSLPVGNGAPALNLSPRRKKEKTFEALLNQLEGLVRQCPVLMIFEDAHWIDPSSLELLDRTTEWMQRRPLLLIVTFRPEFQPPWVGRAHVTTLTLNRLTSSQAIAVVERVTAGKSLPAQILDQIVAHTDGVPLFVEELTKTVLESGLLTQQGDRFALTGPLPPLAIPTTLHDSLMARLDRLAPVREIAQIGAVIGREFPYELLAAVSPLKDSRLHEALDQLATSGLVFRRGNPPDAVYSFKHVLVQDAAYASLLKSKRQELHGRIVEQLVKRDPRIAEQSPEILAHHLTEASLTEPAVAHWQRAGELAGARSAVNEAVAHFRKALDLLRTLPPTEARERQEMSLQAELGGALINVAGLASKEVEDAYIRARDLCERLGESTRQFTIEWGLWRVYNGRADYGRARALAFHLLERVAQSPESDLRLQAHHAAWSSLNFIGEASAAYRHVEAGLVLYDPDAHKGHALTYGGHDPGVCARNNAALVLLRLGFPDQAFRFGEEALALAQRLGHPQIMAHALNWSAPFHQLRRDPARAEAQSALALQIAEEQGFANYCAEQRLLAGWQLAERGRPEEAIGLMRQALAARLAIGTMYWHSYFLALLANAYWQAGQLDAATRVLDEALDWVERTGERWFESELNRLMGDLLLQSGKNADEPERHFRKALGVARAESARMWELRAATSLGRLMRDNGRRREARDVLAPVYGWFTEGFDTPDLQDARALLDELFE